jgi:hypothetical protein
LASRAEGLQHMLQAADMFDILTLEYNNSPVEVEEALVHMDKFTTLSLTDPMIYRWISLVRYNAVLMLLRYENLGWGHQLLPEVQDLP